MSLLRRLCMYALHTSQRRLLNRCLAAACIGAAAWPWATPARQRVWRFGLTPVVLDDRVRLLRSWAVYLEARMAAPVEFVQFSTYNQVVDALRGGQLDCAWVCGYPYVLHRQELQLVCVPLWRGRPLYQSFLIADERATVRGLQDLRGQSFAYSDPLSNSGYLYVQYLLRQQHLDPAQYFARTFFTYSHRHVVEAVAQGLAVAGAVDGYVWETMAEILPSTTRPTRVVLRSPSFGFPPIVAPRTASAAFIQRLTEALKGMAGDSEGREVLGELRLDGFTSATPALYASIAAMARTTQL
ncbi:MAG: PhnD/SsuA/transferrin family substrate-binding protein [Rhodocyclaceae bacterium]|nr:PhnD/SsuA/transferrin family substrate-binding protein [Rhodocyclaceae bacterium]